MACKIITAKLPLKRYGDFRKTVKDIRLRTEEKNGKIESGLLLWFDAERIPLARLKKELEYYNNHRHEVTKAIVNWEYDLMETKQEVVRPDYSKSKGKIKYKAANLMLAKADRDALRNLCTNIVVHTHNLYIGNKAAKRILLTGLSTNDVKTYIEAQAIATPISLNNLNDKLAEITNSFYQNPKTIRAADRLTIDLYDGILTLYENEMPVITHLKMLRNKFAHNQIRYDAILDDSTTILRVQNGQETEGCQAQPNSTNRYIEEVCLIDKNKLITTQLIKYTTEQYNAL
jgi:hypothetical protein